MNRARATKCSCGANLGAEGIIKWYPHNGGWLVDAVKDKSDDPTRQWVYIHCQRCGYDWALWKLMKWW